MKQVILTLLVASTIQRLPAQVAPADRVNPFIGTNGMGHTFPGACVPRGIVQLSPDTGTVPHNINGVYQPRAYDYCAGYQHGDSTIVGFSHTHFSGTGHSDLGDILVMPFTGERHTLPGDYRSRFSHDTEKASPGYYEVVLDDYHVKARLTATERAGVHAYTYPAGENRQLLVDLVHGIYNYDGKVLWASLRVENDTLVTGFRLTNGWARFNQTYFAISFSRPVTRYGYEELEKPAYTGFWRKFNTRENFPDIAGRKIVAFFEFGPGPGEEPIEVKVALSAVSTAGAVANLRAETDGKSFDTIAREAREKWTKELNVIEANGNDDQLAMLYTSLYHVCINPSIYMDVDGTYRGLDNNIHRAGDFTNYTIFSLWDTFRALHPLLNLVAPSRNRDMVESMLAHYRQSVHGALPVWSHMANENWCMIGYHAVSVLADAIAKGLRVDRDEALEAMINSSSIPYLENTVEYLDLGYVPFEKNSNAASITLERAYDDWTIYRVARDAGHDFAPRYRQRALSYRNLIDPATGFARPKYADGSWKEDFNILETHGQGFIEGNSLNYTFHVPHDVAGLIDLMGGDKRFIAKLDSVFNTPLPDAFFEETEDVTREGILGGYVHGNEPSHHLVYLYAWTSEPWKTQFWTREIMNRMYQNHIDGLCGNDDCGQMSAWYIFTALGFYPVCPGSDQYVLGAPYLPYIKVRLENGKCIEIKAPNVSDKNRYVKSTRLNGKPYNKRYITHDDLANGALIEFEMASRPVKYRAGDEKPYSLSTEI